MNNKSYNNKILKKVLKVFLMQLTYQQVKIKNFIISL